MTTKPHHAAILEQFQMGISQQEIGKGFSVSRQRVSQILLAMGVRGIDGGRRVLVNKAQEEKREARNLAYLNKHGCSFLEYKAIPKAAILKYTQQKNNARIRGIGWLFTAYTWWIFWQSSGKWNLRGRGAGYCMARNGDVGPYATGNVYICTVGQNFSDSWTNKPMRMRPARLSGYGKGWSLFKSETMGDRYNVRFLDKRIGSFGTKEEAEEAYKNAAFVHQEANLRIHRSMK